MRKLGFSTVRRWLVKRRGVDPEPEPTNAILTEDGQPILMESGTPITPE